MEKIDFCTVCDLFSARLKDVCKGKKVDCPCLMRIVTWAVVDGEDGLDAVDRLGTWQTLREELDSMGISDPVSVYVRKSVQAVRDAWALIGEGRYGKD